MDQYFLDLLTVMGFHDYQCNKIVFGDCVPEKSKAGERAFYELLKEVVMKESDVRGYEMEDWNFPTYPLPASYQYKMMAAFAGMNVLKFLRYVGIRLGPDFIDYLPFPVWRPAVWQTPKVGKGWAFIGIPQPNIPDAPHPFDYARSTRYNNCVMIRETPDPDVLAGEDYLKHHMHGVRGLASMMALSFIDVDSNKRIFRFYCIQGCSRLYTWDELVNDRKVIEEVKAKIVVKGRIPRTTDFIFTMRDGWDVENRPIIRYAQDRMLKMMVNLAPLFPLKLTVAQLAEYCVMDIAPITLYQLLDGRSGMSYGFLAYQLPSGPVENCTEVHILCTRSGCDKQNPDENQDWVVLSCSTENIYLETSVEMKDTTSPSFDSWLILAQAASNVALAKRFKYERRCSKFVDMVEEKGVALCHFHGYIDKAALPPNLGYWGQDQLPLPCGSVESAFLTVREKRNIAEKVVACTKDIDYIGDVHVEPDHGSVLSSDFDTMEDIMTPSRASYGLSNFTTYTGTWDPTV